MEWEDYARTSEKILTSSQVPSSLELITLIKKVNPTRRDLPESDRERGYQLKSRLQSLLLEHYGDAFDLIPHAVSRNIILIKHRSLPSIDACHARLAALPSGAVDKMETSAPAPPGREEAGGEPEVPPPVSHTALSPGEALHKALALLHEYDYPAAEEVLARLRARDSGDLPLVKRGVATLLYEIGAYQRCIDILLNQPKSVLKDRGVRELLAVAYHHNCSFTEARALLEALNPAELGPEALAAYADIAFKDGNLPAAYELVKTARSRGSLTLGLDSLEKEIENALAAQAEPLVQKARVALEAASFPDARRLAREALDLYVKCQAARDLLATLEAIEQKAELAELWERVEAAESGDERLALLTKLMERDKENQDRVKLLVEEERERQRRLLFDQHLELLRSQVLDQRWSDSFDTLITLSRQPDFRKRCAEILSLSPLFSLLLENKRLRGATDRAAKEPWLGFINVKTSLAAGSADGCLDVLEKLHPWFSSCPDFQEAYQSLLQREQDRARQEIAGLVEQYQAESRVAEARSIFGCIRKRMLVLPFPERQELVRTMEQRLALLTPEPDTVDYLEQYREALQIGNSEKAAYLRREIADTAAMEAVDAHFSKEFHIPTRSLSLEITDDLPIDLTTPPPLDIYCDLGSRFVFRDGEDTLIMIDFAKKSAWTVTSPVFGKIGWVDCIANDVFLMGEKEDGECGETLWRAELAMERAAFTAQFSPREWFEVEEGYSLSRVCMSSERDIDYYISIYDKQGRLPPKLLKKRLAPKGTVESFQAKKGKLALLRWTACPDRFIVGCEHRTRYLNRNLSLRSTLDVPANIYKIDPLNRQYYGIESYLLTQRGQNLEMVKKFENGPAFGIFPPERVHGISFETSTALMILGDGKQCFYNLGNNRFSNKIRIGRVIPNAGRWYCFDYERERGKLRLRDITEDIHTMLEWREFFCIRKKKRKKVMKDMVWFHESDNFVYRPDAWEA